MYGIRFSTAKSFRSLRQASPTVDRPHRVRKGGRRLNILLRKRRLRDRRPPRRESSWSEILLAAAFAALALGLCARQFGGQASDITALLPLPFAIVALIGIWFSHLPYAKKILWSVPAFAFAIPFLPIG